MRAVEFYTVESVYSSTGTRGRPGERDVKTERKKDRKPWFGRKMDEVLQTVLGRKV